MTKFLFALSMSLPQICHALEPQEIFKVAEPSIVVVLAADAKGDKNSLASGVLVSPLDVVTGCKTVEAAADIVVTQGNALRKATLQLKDAERGLCQLRLADPLPAGVPATVPASTAPATGQEIYIIGSPRGMERTISRTMVSSVRATSGSAAPLLEIDTTPPEGSVGAGAFDRTGALLGIALGKFKAGDAASYVVPAEWIAQLPKRSPDQRAAAAVTQAQAPAVAAAAVADATPGAPRVGERWKYRLIDGRRPVGIVAIEIVDAQRKIVTERVTREDDRKFLVDRNVDAIFNPIRFQDVIMHPGGFQLAEIAPYLPAGEELKPNKQWSDIPVTLLITWVGKHKFSMLAKVVRKETVRVPAGQFDATLVEASTKENLGTFFVTVTCKYWYATEVKRTVKMSLQIEYSLSAINSNAEIYELMAYEPVK